MGMQNSTLFRNALAGAATGAINNGRLVLKEGPTARATFNPVSATDTGGVVSVTGSNTAPSSATIDGPIDGWELQNSSGAVLISASNTSFSVAPGDQSPGADSMTIANHGLLGGEEVQWGGVLPSTIPQVTADQVVFVKVVDASTIQFTAVRGGSVIDITAAASGNTIITVLPLVVGDSSSNAALQLSTTGAGSPLEFTTDDLLNISSFSWTAPKGSRVPN